MLGFLNDAWQRFVGNMGVTGPDEGKGGKYLVVPPGYAGEIPEGYFLLKPPTNRNFMFLRGSIKDGLEPAVENITSKLRVYPLKDAAAPAATEFVNMSNKAFNTVFPSDFSFFEDLDAVVQGEPVDAISPEVRGAIASIGIVKGQPFAPDDRMRKLLTEAATLGDATSRVITYHPRIDGVRIYPDNPDSVWSTAFANKNTSFEADGTMGLDARVLYYFNAGGVTPAMAATRAGEGSDYALALLDFGQEGVRRRENLQADPAGGRACQRLLGADHVRHPDPLPASDRPELPDHRQPDRGHDAERRRLLRHLVRAGGSEGHGRQLAPDRPRQELVHHPAHVRPARALDQQDLASRRDRTGSMTPDRKTPVSRNSRSARPGRSEVPPSA